MDLVVWGNPHGGESLGLATGFVFPDAPRK